MHEIDGRKPNIKITDRVPLIISQKKEVAYATMELNNGGHIEITADCVLSADTIIKTGTLYPEKPDIIIKGIKGKDGGKGENGEDGGPGPEVSFTVYDMTENILIDICGGGNGGNGGDGGEGGSGGDGGVGGGSGGNGGKGGKGGDGGNGGSGAKLTFKYRSNNGKAVSYKESVSAGGAGGQRGIGGKGGSGVIPGNDGDLGDPSTPGHCGGKPIVEIIDLSEED